ncbi:MAG: BREX system ATP-binding domain-containing protein, partial [Waterburya sp.]
ASAKRIAGIKGDIGSRKALDYLQGILEIVKAAGYKGLVIVIDEAETILRMRQDIRAKSLNGIRQICDAADRYQGLLWIFTGTPEFFDTQRGIAGLAPLHDRIKFSNYEGFVNLRQPQLELKPFDRERLKEVALKLRDAYPIDPTATIPNKINQEFIQQLIDRVTTGFRGDVGVVPRQFLREFVNILDLAHQNKNFDPAQLKEFKPQDLNIHEESIVQEQNYFEPEPDDIKGYEAIEF